jgi:predicted acylesterase/phospholipase RssA
VTLSDGQRLALRQLRSIEAASVGGLEILDSTEPASADGYLVVCVSIDCAGIESQIGGVAIRERELFELLIPPGFPFDDPTVRTPHTRWAGTPHVQWQRQLCLYLAPTIEWIPARGMHGFLERLFEWCKRAASGTLDPEGAPLHAPVAYTSRGAPMVIPRANAPTVTGAPWLGSAVLEHPSDWRYDIVGWEPEFDATGDVVTPAPGSAAAVLLAEPMAWEYPETVDGLLSAISDRGVPMGSLVGHLGWVAWQRPQGAPLIVIVGAPGLGTVGDQLRQHLTAWRIPGADADNLALALTRYFDEARFRAMGEEAIRAVATWSLTAKAEWCRVAEARREIVERRDSKSPLRSFAGKKVVIWGAGALGGPLAECTVRAGAREVVIYDYAPVQPGVLVRQPYTDADIGFPKATALEQKLSAINPRDCVVDGHIDNVLTESLERGDWHDGADIVIDATASIAVQSKLERVRRLHPQPATIITAVIGHTAEHGVATIAHPEHTGAAVDTLRAAKLLCARSSRMAPYLREFWPDPPRANLFQPEPGCSSPTFRGSAAEVNALAGLLMTNVARELADPSPGETAVACFAALPTVTDGAPASARFSLPTALVLPDANDTYEVRVAPAAAADMRAWIASCVRRLGPSSETGGLILGQRDDAVGVIWIDEVTDAPADSIESPDEFVCGTAGVEALIARKRKRTSRSLDFLGIWHTHPGMSPAFSPRDLVGMVELLDASDSPGARGLVVIVGWPHERPTLAAYTFENDELRKDAMRVEVHETRELPESADRPRDVGVALSGGGSRAIAFHLGCLRALHDRGVLDRVQVVSGASGGSIMTAMWAYYDDGFDEFDARARAFLRRGLKLEIARRAVLSRRGPQAVGARVASSVPAIATYAAHKARSGAQRLRGTIPSARPDTPVRRSVSRTDAFADALAASVCGELAIDAPRRDDVAVVINACDLRTGSAFRFGSKESGTWQHWTLVGNDVQLATAVAASAAYPPALPALDKKWEFERPDGQRHSERVVLTDGGVFDNLGTSCLRPGRDPAYSTNVFDVEYVIACDAGRGLLAPRSPVGWASRQIRVFEATHRKLQDGARGELHRLAENGDLRGFLLPYLGQRDSQIPYPPLNLVPREAVVDYPTDFDAMSDANIELLSKRGEQLTRTVMATYCPEL